MNDFAKDLELPIDLEPAVGIIAAGLTRDVDVGEVNGQIFINNSSIGLYPLLILERARTQRSSGLSKWPAMMLAVLEVNYANHFGGLKLRPRLGGASSQSVRICWQQSIASAGRFRSARPSGCGEAFCVCRES